MFLVVSHVILELGCSEIEMLKLKQICTVCFNSIEKTQSVMTTLEDCCRVSLNPFLLEVKHIQFYNTSS